MKKKLLFLLCSLSFLYATPATQVDVQAGVGLPIFGTPNPSATLGFMSYRYTNNWYYVALGAGGWLGERGTGIGNLGVGLNYQDFSIGTGPSYITHLTTTLGTHFQFMSAARWTFNPLPIFVEYDHISNASKIFGGNNANQGENFLGLGYAF